MTKIGVMRFNSARFFSAGVFIAAGFGMGWVSAKLSSSDTDMSTRKLVALPQEAALELASPLVTKETVSAPANTANEGFGQDFRDVKPASDGHQVSFLALLKAGKFSRAMDRLSRVRQLDEREFVQMRQSLLSFLDGLMSSDQSKAFTELVDAYLADSYDDIEVLLLLAEFNKRNAFYFEAVAVFDLADEYAYAMDGKAQVAAAFAAFLREVDAFLVDRDDWYHLSQVYFQAEIAGLLTADQRVRQAAIYVKNGDIYEGKKILTELRNAGSLSKQGKDILAGLSKGDGVNVDNLPLSAASYGSGVALSAIGNQFLIEVGLDADQPSVLLIDTGASMTTLSRSGFDKVRYGIDAREIGTRMFSTANGLTKGHVYQVSEFTIGQYRLTNVEIAVLDFDMGGGAEGLLGMNVLGKFKFQLDQERPQLLLKPR